MGPGPLTLRPSPPHAPRRPRRTRRSAAASTSGSAPRSRVGAVRVVEVIGGSGLPVVGHSNVSRVMRLLLGSGTPRSLLRRRAGAEGPGGPSERRPGSGGTATAAPRGRSAAVLRSSGWPGRADAEEDVGGDPEAAWARRRRGARARARRMWPGVKSRDRHATGTLAAVRMLSRRELNRALLARQLLLERATLPLPARARARLRDPGAVRAVDVHRAVVAARRASSATT